MNLYIYLKEYVYYYPVYCVSKHLYSWNIKTRATKIYLKLKTSTQTNRKKILIIIRKFDDFCYLFYNFHFSKQRDV